MIAALVVLLTLLAAVLSASLAYLGRLRELHHGYYGAALIAGAAVVPHELAARICLALGAALLADDALQHGLEAIDKLRGEVPRADFTPVHVLGSHIVQAWRDASHVTRDVAAAVAGVLVVAVLAFCHPPTPRLPAAVQAVQARVDSARATEVPDSLHRDTLYHQAAANADRAHARVTQAQPARHVADSLGAAIAAQPVPVDSDAAGWRDRYALQTARAESLTVVVAQQDTAITFLSVAEQQATAAAIAAEVRLAALEQLNRELVAVTEVLKKPPRPSRHLHWRPCLYGGAGPSLSLAGIGVQPQVGGGACLTYDRG